MKKLICRVIRVQNYSDKCDDQDMSCATREVQFEQRKILRIFEVGSWDQSFSVASRDKCSKYTVDVQGRLESKLESIVLNAKSID